MANQISRAFEISKITHQLKVSTKSKLSLFRFDLSTLVALVPKIENSTSSLWDLHWLLESEIDISEIEFTEKKERKTIGNRLKEIVRNGREKCMSFNFPRGRIPEEFYFLVSSRLWFSTCLILQKFFTPSFVKNSLFQQIKNLMDFDFKFSERICQNTLYKCLDMYQKGFSNYFQFLISSFHENYEKECLQNIPVESTKRK